MQKIVRRIIEYKCEICGVKYGDKKDALKCERRQLEPKKFKKGDAVKGIELHTCNHRSRDINFVPAGLVVSISGPKPMDEDYSHRWLGGQLLSYHVFSYEVLYKCFCGKERGHLYYSVELVKQSQESASQ